MGYIKNNKKPLPVKAGENDLLFAIFRNILLGSLWSKTLNLF